MPRLENSGLGRKGFEAALAFLPSLFTAGSGDISQIPGSKKVLPEGLNQRDGTESRRLTGVGTGGMYL